MLYAYRLQVLDIRRRLNEIILYNLDLLYLTHQNSLLAKHIRNTNRQLTNVETTGTTQQRKFELLEFRFTNSAIQIFYTGCNRIMYKSFKIYFDETNRNFAAQFVAEHVLTLRVYLQVSSMVAICYVAYIQAML
jgi:hypothetical protein